MAHTILRKFHPSAKLLDDMLFKLETNLGRAHAPSPFAQLYTKYNYSPAVEQQSPAAEAPPKEEAKKDRAPKEEQQKKAAQPMPK
jgi:hypothetical protein